jgi:hypothetical protein
MAEASAATLSPSVGAGGTPGQLQDKNAKTLFSPVFQHSQQNKCSSPKTHGKEYQTQLIFLTGYYRAF